MELQWTTQSIKYTMEQHLTMEKWDIFATILKDYYLHELLDKILLQQGLDTRLKQRDEKYYTRYNHGMEKTKSTLTKRDN